MKLTAEQAKDIQKRASTYGCGAWNCCACYPLEYFCDCCDEELETPILNGQRVYCDNCGELQNGAYDTTEQQREFWKKIEQMFEG